MIRDGVITYPGADSAFRNWQPDNPFVYELLFAALTTCLVYQLTKIVLDIGFGQRKPGNLLISDLYQFVMVSNFSCRSILSSLGCRGFVARRRFHGSGTECQAKPLPEKTLHISALVKYFLLLVAAPVIHMVGIYLSVERQKVVSFADVEFGGVAFGISDDDPIVDAAQKRAYCPSFRMRYARGETPLAEFFRCFGIGSFQHANDFADDMFVLMLRVNSWDMGVTIVTPSRRWISITFLDMHTGDSPYRFVTPSRLTKKRNCSNRAIAK